MEEKTGNAQRDDAAVNAGNRAAGDNDGGGAAAEIPEAVWVLKIFGSYTMRDMRRVRLMSLHFLKIPLDNRCNPFYTVLVTTIQQKTDRRWEFGDRSQQQNEPSPV